MMTILSLPKPQTSYIDHPGAIATARQLLKEARLLTITGAGGSGKTRLALRLVEQITAGENETSSSGGYPGGVAWVDLAMLDKMEAATPEVVAQAVAASLQLTEQPHTSWADLLAERLAGDAADSRLLLVLDNCEHLATACADLLDFLLPAAPGLCVLATSRQPLDAAGERTWQIPLLAAPRAGATLEQVAATDAVRLFCARAAVAAPMFRLDEHNAAAVAQVCRELEGLPLAIELAAARTNVLSSQQIAERLGDSQRLLAREGKISDARHRTLRAALEWSLALLPPAERTLFARLAVFAGSFSLSAAEAVCAGDSIAPGDTLDLIAGLVDTSLLAVIDCRTTLRYRLLQPLRQCAAEQLAEGERALWTARHAAWCLALAEDAAPHLDGPQQAHWLDRLALEHDELRAALHWCAAAPERSATGLRLSRALGRFWCLRSHLREGRQWLETFLGAEEQAGGQLENLLPVRADAVNALARIVFLAGDFAAARDRFAQALEVARRGEYDEGVETAQTGLGTVLWELGNYGAARTHLEEIVRYAQPLGHWQTVGRALNSLGLVALHQGDSAAATSFFRESLAVNQRTSNQVGYATALYNLAMQASHGGDYARAGLLYREALAIQEALGNRSVVADILVNLGGEAAAQNDFNTAASYYRQAEEIYTALGTLADNAYVYAGLGEVAFYACDYPEAQRRYAAALGLFRQAGNQRLIGRALGWLGRIACRQGDLPAAATLCAEALALRQTIGHKMGIVFSLDLGYSELAMAAGRPAVAARLLGAVEHARQEHGRPREPVETQQAQQTIAAVQARLGAAELTLCWNEGQEMALEEAAAYALDTLSPGSLAAPARNLRLLLLGRGRIYCGDRLLSAADWTYSKARELVFYLLCHPDSTREQVGLAFWPDASPEQVRKRFSAALAHARTALGRDAETIRLVDGRYRLDPARGFWCDLHEFEARLRAARRLLQTDGDRQAAAALLEDAAALYGGDLLEDMTADDWPQARREALQADYLDALLLLGGLHQEASRYDEAIAVYRLALTQDVYSEEAHIELMRCQVRSGRRRESLRQYEALRAALAELGAAPSPAAESLVARIRHNQPV